MAPKVIRPTKYIEGQSYGIIDRTTGYPVSFGTVVSKDLSDNFDVIPLAPPEPGQVWDPETRKYVAYVPTPEEAAAEEAEQAAVTERETDSARVAELRALVGPGKPGLTQEQRDELNVILANLQLNP